MVAVNFDTSLARVLVHEGGYSNHPADPGGPTNKGIIQRVYDGWRKSQGQPIRSVKLIEDAEVRAIYRRQYWDAIRGDDLPPGLDYAVFDAAVNSGPAQSAKWLQRALGVTDDGQIGEATLLAARKARDKVQVVQGICDRRLAMLKTLKTWPTFGVGWGRRVADVRAAATALVYGDAPPDAPSGGHEAPGKALAVDRSITSVIKTPEGLAGAVAIGTAALNAAADPGPLQWALAVAVVATVAVASTYFLRRARAAS